MAIICWHFSYLFIKVLQTESGLGLPNTNISLKKCQFSWFADIGSKLNDLSYFSFTCATQIENLYMLVSNSTKLSTL